MHPTDLLPPLAGRWLRRVQSDLDLVPHPTDAPRQVAPGPDADRVLVLGNGPAIGFGVRSHELSLPGALARRLIAQTGRGAIVDLAAQRGVRIEHGIHLARGARLPLYDAVVLSLGATDAAGLLGPERWREGLIRLLDDLAAACSPTTALLVLPIGPLQRTSATDGPWRRIAEAAAARLDRISAEVCADRGGVDFLPPDTGLPAPRTPADYDALAERVAALLAPRLDLLVTAPSNAGARVQRSGPDPEVLRQEAVERSGLIGTSSNAELDRLLQTARDLFGASAAAVTLIDGDRVVFKASSGMPADGVSRSLAPCNLTIRQDGAVVIPDLIGEPIAEHGMRFYAGHPMESPDGFRIGTLCILDGRPRRPGDVDEVALVELAARVQAELWREIEQSVQDDTAASLTDTGSLRLPVLVHPATAATD